MRRKAKDETYLLTGKLYCGDCGSPMSGISGKSNGVTPFYYYTCTKKKYEHTCSKKNVRREQIERAVTVHLRQLLQDDGFLEWMADKTMEHLFSERDTAELEDLQAKLKEAKTAKENILKMIEKAPDILPDSLLARLKDREKEERDLTARVAILEKDFKIDVSRDDVLSWLETLRDGDVDDRNFQEMMIDAFLIRAYVFDDHLKLVFRYTKEPGEITVPLEIFGGEEDGSSAADSSSKLFTSPHYVTQANYSVTMIKGYFVCDVPFAV